MLLILDLPYQYRARGQEIFRRASWLNVEAEGHHWYSKYFVKSLVQCRVSLRAVPFFNLIDDFGITRHGDAS